MCLNKINVSDTTLLTDMAINNFKIIFTKIRIGGG